MKKNSTHEHHSASENHSRVLSHDHWRYVFRSDTSRGDIYYSKAKYSGISITLFERA